MAVTAAFLGLAAPSHKMSANVSHVSSIFYGSIAYGSIPLGCLLLGWMSFTTFCGLNSCLLMPVRCFTYCKMQFGPVKLNLASFFVLASILFLLIETSVMLQHAHKLNTSQNDYKLRMILLGTKWRSERNFYMALLNMVLWLSITFFGIHLEKLLAEREEPVPDEEAALPGQPSRYGATNVTSDLDDQQL